MRVLAIAVVAMSLAGCATTYQLSVMPRDSGKIYNGTASADGGGEGRIAVNIEGKTYEGTWVQVAPERTYGYAAGGYGWGWGSRWYGGLGGTISMDNPQGGEAKALLTASDGSGLRCDLRTGQGHGGGVCRDDRGREYDVQLRPAPKG